MINIVVEFATNKMKDRENVVKHKKTQTPNILLHTRHES